MSCNTIREDFAHCVMNSPCYKDQGYSVQACLQEHAGELPKECFALRNALYYCKRAMLDPKKRIRGRDISSDKRRKEQELLLKEQVEA